MGAGLRPLPLTAQAVHLCVDMQLIFSAEGPWATPWMERVLPVVEAISERFPERTVFTRFITPQRAEEMPGTWRRYYEAWPETTRDRLDIRLLADLAPAQPAGDRDRQDALFGFFWPCFAAASPCPPGRHADRDRLGNRRLRVGDDHGGGRSWIARDPRQRRRLQLFRRRPRRPAAALSSPLQRTDRDSQR